MNVRALQELHYPFKAKARSNYNDLIRRAGQNVVVAAAQELAMDCGADESAMPGNVDAAIGLHEAVSFRIV
jgi:hypothetical protein